MEAWDKRFMSHSTAVRTCPVAAGDIGATDFDLTKEQQDWLLNSGKTAAAAFPADFKLEDYVNTYGKKLTPTAATV